MRELGIGLIGTGFMGRAHALAFRNVSAVFELPFRLTLAALADADPQRARHCAEAWGFAGHHSDWQQLIDDPKVNLVAITTPNHLHYPMAMAALAAAAPEIARASSKGIVHANLAARKVSRLNSRVKALSA